MVQLRSGRQTDKIDKINKVVSDRRKTIARQQREHAHKQQSEAQSRRMKKWFDENQGKTEDDYNKMRMSKFRARQQARQQG